MATSYITGIDIAPHSIKAVLLKRSSDEVRIERCFSIASTHSIFVDNHTVEYQSCVNLLKKLRKQLPANGRKVALALPDNAAASKVLQVQAGLEPEELMFAVKQEMALQTNANDDGLYLDYYPVASALKGSATLKDYQVIAAKKSVVDSHIEPVAKAGFQPHVMTLHGQALTSVWKLANQAQNDEHHWMLVHIAGKSMSLCALPYNADPYIKELHIPPSIGGPQDEQANIARTLMRQVNLYNSSHPQQKINGVWLSGALPGTLDADKLMIQIELVVERLEALTLLEQSGDCKLPKDASSFEIALGLAMLGSEWRGDDETY